MAVANGPVPVLPTARTRPLARDSGAVLSPFAGDDLDIRIAGRSEPIRLPAAAVRVLVDALAQLAQGYAVSVVSQRTELSLAEAADYLGVSTATIARHIDAGELVAHGEGPDQWIALHHLLALRQDLYERRLAALAELSALDQDLGLV